MGINGKLSKLLLALLACFTASAVMANSERDINFAIEKTAQNTIAKMKLAPNVKGVSSIAFIGFSGDKKGFSATFRAALHNVPSSFKFYTRKDVEWGLLTQEIELSEKRGDIMDPKTLQKFGDFKGVQAYMYGAIREASIDPDGAAVFRVTLTLSRIETGQQIWEGNIVGRYKGAINREEVSAELVKAAADAGRKIKDKLLTDKSKLPNCNIFVLPLVGNKANSVSDVLISQVVVTGDNKLSVYSNPTSVSKLEINDIAQELEANASSLDQEQLNTVMQKLEKIYNISPGSASDKYGNKVNTYLIGRVMNANEKDGSLIVDIKLRNFVNNKIIWAGVVEGKYIAPSEPPPLKPSNQWLAEFWKNNSTLIIIIGSILLVLIAVPVMIFMIAMVTRAR